MATADLSIGAMFDFVVTSTEAALRRVYVFVRCELKHILPVLLQHFSMHLYSLYTYSVFILYLYVIHMKICTYR